MWRTDFNSEKIAIYTPLQGIYGNVNIEVPQVLTDITYALSFSTLTIIFFAWKQNFHMNQILVFILVSLWAVRLRTYVFVRNIKIKVDHRFDEMRNSFLKFGGF